MVWGITQSFLQIHWIQVIRGTNFRRPGSGGIPFLSITSIFMFHTACSHSTYEDKVITHTEKRQKYVCQLRLLLKMNLHQDTKYSLHLHCVLYK